MQITVRPIASDLESTLDQKRMYYLGLRMPKDDLHAQQSQNGQDRAILSPRVTKPSSEFGSFCLLMVVAI